MSLCPDLSLPCSLFRYCSGSYRIHLWMYLRYVDTALNWWQWLFCKKLTSAEASWLLSKAYLCLGLSVITSVIYYFNCRNGKGSQIAKGFNCTNRKDPQKPMIENSRRVSSQVQSITLQYTLLILARNIVSHQVIKPLTKIHRQKKPIFFSLHRLKYAAPHM